MKNLINLQLIVRDYSFRRGNTRRIRFEIQNANFKDKCSLSLKMDIRQAPSIRSADWDFKLFLWLLFVERPKERTVKFTEWTSFWNTHKQVSGVCSTESVKLIMPFVVCKGCIGFFDESRFQKVLTLQVELMQAILEAY